MLFTLTSVIAVAATLVGLAFYRFRASRPEARSTLLYAVIFRMFLAWLALRTIQMSRQASPKAWLAYIKALPLWRFPVAEKRLFVGLYASFLCLAASGFCFAIFIPRGLYGYPLIGHVTAGGLFAVCLVVLVLFKGRNFIAVPKPVRLSVDLLDLGKLGITAARVKVAAFWTFALAGFLLTLSALLPMLPLLRTSGQKFMFEFHRYCALASLLAAIVLAGLELFESGGRGREPAP